MSRGFTLLEMLMVVMLLGVVARLVMAALPEKQAMHPLEQLEHSARWAWEQAQLEGRIWRMELSANRWQLATLSSEENHEPGPLPFTFWHPVVGQLARGNIDAGELQPLGMQNFPATLWFLPDGDMTRATLDYRSQQGDSYSLTLEPARFSGAM